FAGARAARGHLYRSGHQLADRHGLRIGAAERHFPKDVALGKDSGNPELGVDYCYGSNVMVEHFVDGVGYAGFQRDRCNLPVTKLKHAHKHLLPTLDGSW